MIEVVQELQNIKSAYEKTMKIQKQSFPLELEKVNKKLKTVKSRVIIIEKKVQLLKNCKSMLKKKLA